MTELSHRLLLLVRILQEQPAEGDNAAAFYRERTERAKLYAGNLGDAGRAQALADISTYREAFRPRPFSLDRKSIEPAVHEALLAAQGFLEQDYSLIECKPVAMCQHPDPVPQGHGSTPVAFVRSALFTDATPERKVFDVLGLKNVQVLRSEHPLTPAHLNALVYALAMVKEWHPQNGCTVSFNAWHAVRDLKMGNDTAALKRLFDDLARTEVLVVHDEASRTEEQDAMVGRRLTSMDKRTKWEVHLSATLLNLLAKKCGVSYLNFRDLAALPHGAATWLYAFIRSQSARTEWDLDDLYTLSGLTITEKTTEPEKRRKMKGLLDLLQSGERVVKVRGKAAHEQGELIDTPHGLRVQATGTVCHTFEPPLKAWAFEVRGRGKAKRTRVVIERELTKQA